MSKVLVAFDGSESAVKAVGHAAEMVLKDPATEVTILTVVNTLNLDFFEASLDVKDKFINTLIESGKDILDNAKRIFDEKRNCYLFIEHYGRYTADTGRNETFHNGADELYRTGYRGRSAAVCIGPGYKFFNIRAEHVSSGTKKAVGEFDLMPASVSCR